MPLSRCPHRYHPPAETWQGTSPARLSFCLRSATEPCPIAASKHLPRTPALIAICNAVPCRLWSHISTRLPPQGTLGPSLAGDSDGGQDSKSTIRKSLDRMHKHLRLQRRPRNDKRLLDIGRRRRKTKYSNSPTCQHQTHPSNYTTFESKSCVPKGRGSCAVRKKATTSH